MSKLVHLSILENATVLDKKPRCNDLTTGDFVSVKNKMSISHATYTYTHTASI